MLPSPLRSYKQHDLHVKACTSYWCVASTSPASVWTTLGTLIPSLCIYIGMTYTPLYLGTCICIVPPLFTRISTSSNVFCSMHALLFITPRSVWPCRATSRLGTLCPLAGPRERISAPGSRGIQIWLRRPRHDMVIQQYTRPAPKQHRISCTPVHNG